MIKSFFYSQDEILRWIQKLYSPQRFELDPTYGYGGFYKGRTQRPKICLDIRSVLAVDARADFHRLPLKNESVKSIIFDPPFLVRGGPGHNIMASKYGALKTPGEVWAMYRDGMCELKRVLKPQGLLVVKCQDFSHGRNQYMTHTEVMNYAVEIGLYPKDIFILLARSRPIARNQKKQNHSRKFHTYFWVFGKQRRSIGYSRDLRNLCYGDLRPEK